MFELVKTLTEDDIVLSGLFLKPEKDKSVFLYVHGFEGDFFTNDFVLKTAKKLQSNKLGMLTVQTRGMANDYTLNTSKYGSGRRIGAHLELLEEAYLDIDSWVKFLVDLGYTNIILGGHSLGTFKTVSYLFEGKYSKYIKKIILLSPFDNFYLLEDYTKGKWREYLKAAKKKIRKGKGKEIVPTSFLDVPMSYQTYISWFTENEYNHAFDFHDKNYKFPVLNKIKIPVKVIVGSKDEYFYTYNPKNPDEAMEILKKNIRNFSGTFIKGSKHSFVGFSERVAQEILKFI